MQQRRPSVFSAVPWILSGTLCCTAGWAQDPPPAEVKPIVKDAVRRDRIEDRRDRREAARPPGQKHPPRPPRGRARS